VLFIRFFNLFFYPVVRHLGRKSVNKYLYLYEGQTSKTDCRHWADV